MDAQDRLKLDGAFKKVARAQGNIARLADEGVDKTMANVDQKSWDGYFDRLQAARHAAEIAQDELESLFRKLVLGQT